MSTITPESVHSVLLMLTPEQIPAVKSVWRHTNGNHYKVAALTNMGSTNPQYVPTVVYFNVEHGTWWSRSLADWHRSMTKVNDPN